MKINVPEDVILSIPDGLHEASINKFVVKRNRMGKPIGMISYLILSLDKMKHTTEEVMLEEQGLVGLSEMIYKLSGEYLKPGEFEDVDFEKYVSDRIVGRRLLVGIKNNRIVEKLYID